MANGADPDQMAHSVMSDLSLHCLHRPVLEYYCYNKHFLAFVLNKSNKISQEKNTNPPPTYFHLVNYKEFLNITT